MHARNCAVRGAAFLGKKFALATLQRVIGERYAWVAALLRAVMHQAVFADVEVARTRAAPPVVFEALRNIALKFVNAREGLLTQRHNLVKNLLLARTEGFQLAVMVVDDSHGGCKS